MIIPEPHVPFTSSGFDFEFAAPSDYARLYRLRGIQVVPAFMSGEPEKGLSWKRPLLSSWTEFQEALIPDDKFAEWYGHNGQFVTRPNLGAITGRASDNLLVIDLDDYKNLGAKEWWENLIRDENNRIEPETVEQRTGGGGRQKIFRAPPGWVIPNKNIHSMGIDIKGQGGFVMLPPSLHESGKHYEWAEGQSPDDIPIAMAEPWLLEAVSELVEKHGGLTTSSRKTNGQGPEPSYSAFGKHSDGRETYMRDMIWAAVVGYRAEAPIPLGDHEKQKVWEDYLRHTDPKETLPGETQETALERERRGYTEFTAKWDRSVAKWGDEVEQAAKVRPPKLEGYDRGTGNVVPIVPLPAGPLILTDVQFLKDYRPPDYLVDGLVQKGYLYSLTGPTGHGKTPVSMLMACKVARGAPYHGKPVAQGSVLFLAGENSDDIRSRYIAMADHEGFEPGAIPFYFIDGVIDIAAQIARIEVEAALIPNLSLVVVDTDQAYFLGDEGNSNEQRKAFAQTLRRLLKLPGNPTVLVNCHPTKNATSDNLVPIGGSAFLNEIDGNIMCWAEDRTCTVRPHTSKWRGVAFESFAFELKTITSDRLKDTQGRHIPSVIAIPITEAGAERRLATAKADEDVILRLMDASKDASMMELARRALFTLPDGTPAKAKVQRIMERLKRSKLIYNYRGGTYRITRKGCKAIGVKWRSGDDDDDDDN